MISPRPRRVAFPFRRRVAPVAAALGLALCGLVSTPVPAVGQEGSAPRSAEAVKTIYIATFRGCEEVCEAFKTYLVDRGHAVAFVERSVDRDLSRAPELVAEVRETRPDLLVTWGTGISLAMLGRHDATDDSAYIRDIPAVYLYVAEPVRSGLVADEFVSGRANVAGANIGVPLDAQLRVVQSYRPVDTIGVVFGPDEANSVAAVAALREATAKAGIGLVEEPLELGGDGKPLVESILPAMQRARDRGAEFVVTVSSTFIISNVEAYTRAAVAAGLPVFTSAELPIRRGSALLALFASLSSIGQVAGFQAEQILAGGDPQTLPTPSIERFTLLVNMSTAHELELYPPMLVLSFADLIR